MRIFVTKVFSSSNACTIGGCFTVCEVSCSATNLFRLDMLRCWEDVGVRGALKDPVQRFQLLLSEGICPKVFP